ncbi:MAG: WcbI family polysaccharide biosynthesis putative acetyltransferase [Rhodococcus sp. (in: high G+C Gram-positive bacteria)]
MASDMTAQPSSEPSGRTRHYGEFYGIDDVPSDRPLWIVLGNCQAEAVRVMLSTVQDAPFHAVRMPPVHELEASDIDSLRRLASHAGMLIAQPIRDDYRDLPVGTSQVAQMLPKDAGVVRWPVFRYSGLYPFQAIVRHPGDPSATPAGAPYHDLRTVLAAAAGADADDEWRIQVRPEALRANAEASLAELSRRERRDCDVAISDVISSQGAAAAHTINHPGNDVLADLAARVLDAAGIAGTPTDPGRVLLNSVHTPLESQVVDGLGLDAAPRPEWTIDGDILSANVIHRRQLQWYAEHPEFVEAALMRHADTVALLGTGN